MRVKDEQIAERREFLLHNGWDWRPKKRKIVIFHQTFDYGPISLLIER